MEDRARLLVLAGVLAAFGEPLQGKAVKTYRSSTRCKTCHKEIPPGRADRECKECRESKSGSPVL